MEDFYYKTDYAHSTNEITMHDFLENYMNDYCGEDYEIIHHDGTYAEIKNNDGIIYAVHAMGNGDFTHHRIVFELLKNPNNQEIY